MSSTKPLNFSPINIDSDYTLQPNTYNVVYADMATAATLTIPDGDIIGGFVIFIKNNGPEMLTVRTISGGFNMGLNAGETMVIFLDTDTNSWNTIIGPINEGGSGGGITGPMTSTNNAIVLWNGASGSVIKNSSLLVSGNTLSTNSGNLSITSATNIVDFANSDVINVNTLVANNITNSSGTYESIFGNKIPVVGLTTTDILSIPIDVGSSKTMEISVSYINTTNNSDSGAFTSNVKVKNIGGTITFNSFGTSSYSDASLANSTITYGTSPTNFIIRASGVVGINTAYQASVEISGIDF